MFLINYHKKISRNSPHFVIYRHHTDIYIYICTGHTQKNGAVSKVNKKFMSHNTRHNIHRQRRQLSKFLMRYQQFASHAYCVASFKDGVAAGEGFLCAPF
jgi:G:T-mismatch repair DNA endonuclease (very short patch repair protein)